MSNRPARKPPMWANQATPPISAATGWAVIEATPFANCRKNHKMMIKKAGSSASWIKKKTGTSVNTRAPGKSRR